MISDLIKLLRLRQWTKNFFIFIPLFFSGQLLNIYLLLNNLIAFVSFCFIASSIYCLNDIIDINADRKHPIKKNRPIASNKISIRQGYAIMIICLLVGILFPIIIINENHIKVLSVFSIYILLNIAYCLYLKKIALIDVMIVSLGFVFRILVGGYSANIQLSNWLIIMTFLLALFLALAKRRDDVIIFEKTNVTLRKNIDKYNVSFLNQAITIVATIIVVSYIMYTISEKVMHRFNSEYLYVTSIFVLLGILRYMQLTIVEELSGSPTEILFKDRIIQSSILGWVLLYSYIIYF